LLLLLSVTGITAAQNTVEEFLVPSDTLNIKRRNIIVTTEAVFAVGTFTLLNELWYSDYPKSDFHFTNDNAEWLQMDKAGHVFSGYHLSRFGAEALNWSGVSKSQQILYGAATGFVFLSTVEIFDGFSSNWGASAGDLASNAAGAALFVSQEYLWGEQRIVPKFSFHTTPYASARPSVLGSSASEQLLKDYNGQTYWLSANVHSFVRHEHVPKWLNIAVGYGAEGMITGNDQLVNTIFLPEKQRFRQFYFSLDADLTKIQTQSNFLKTMFSIVNVIKIPAPTFEVSGKGNVRFHILYF
jgi:uncharacterized protein YfiM (DUF2279 family)